MNGSWAVRIERLPIELAVGVHAHERAPQPVQVSLVIKGRAAARPDALGDCLDYDPLLRWLTDAWPASPHAALLETRLNELFTRCFGLDHRIDSVWAGIYKQALGRGTAAVGIERAVTRREFDAQRCPLMRSTITALAAAHGQVPPPSPASVPAGATSACDGARGRVAARTAPQERRGADVVAPSC